MCGGLVCVYLLYCLFGFNCVGCIGCIGCFVVVWQDVCEECVDCGVLVVCFQVVYVFVDCCVDVVQCDYVQVWMVFGFVEWKQVVVYVMQDCFVNCFVVVDFGD